MRQTMRQPTSCGSPSCPNELHYGRHAKWLVNGVWYPVWVVPVEELLERENWVNRVLAYGPTPLADRFVSHRSGDEG